MWKMWVNVRPACRIIVQHSKNLNVAIFLEARNVINVKLCTVVLVTELYLFIFQWPWPYFKVTAVSNSFNWNVDVLIWSSWNSVGLLSISSISWIYLNFSLLHKFKGDNWHVSLFDKNFNIGFFADTVQVIFKLSWLLSCLGPTN